MLGASSTFEPVATSSMPVFPEYVNSFANNAELYILIIIYIYIYIRDGQTQIFTFKLLVPTVTSHSLFPLALHGCQALEVGFDALQSPR